MDVCSTTQNKLSNLKPVTVSHLIGVFVLASNMNSKHKSQGVLKPELDAVDLQGVVSMCERVFEL